MNIRNSLVVIGMVAAVLFGFFTWVFIVMLPYIIAATGVLLVLKAFGVI